MRSDIFFEQKGKRLVEMHFYLQIGIISKIDMDRVIFATLKILTYCNID